MPRKYAWGARKITLQQFVNEGRPPFDLIFIDADKAGYADYLKWSLKLARPGTLIVADNVVRKGEVANPASKTKTFKASGNSMKMLAAEKRVTTTVIQTVGK